jgi:hypothetical protein
MEGEKLSVVPVEGCLLHMIEDDHIPKNLPNPFSRPSMQWKTFNVDFDMVKPIGGMSVRIATPRLNLVESASNKERANVNNGIALLRVVEPDQEVLGLMGRDRNVLMWEPKLPMQLIGNRPRTDL